jgi:hypothetical protein
MVHYGPHQALSDATPIARGNIPLAIPILITMEANRLRATGQQKQLEFLLLVDLALDDASASTAKKRLGALNSTLT